MRPSEAEHRDTIGTGAKAGLLAPGLLPLKFEGERPNIRVEEGQSGWAFAPGGLFG